MDYGLGGGKMEKSGKRELIMMGYFGILILINHILENGQDIIMRTVNEGRIKFGLYKYC